MLVVKKKDTFISSFTILFKPRSLSFKKLFVITKYKSLAIDFDPYCKMKGGGKLSHQNANNVLFVGAFVLHIKWIFAYQSKFCGFTGICLPMIRSSLHCVVDYTFFSAGEECF